MDKRKFFQSAAILTAGSGAMRLVDIWFRGFLISNIGATSMGLFQLNMSVFALGVSVSAAGASFCATRLIAERGNCRTTVRRCLTFSLLVSCTAALLLELAAPFLGAMLSGTAPLRVLALGLPFISVCACLKGCFLAEGHPLVPAIAEVVEQGASIGLCILFVTRSNGSILALMTSSTLSEVCGCVFIVLLYRLKLRAPKGCAEKDPPSFRYIAGIGLPVLCGAGLRSLLFTVENLLIPRGLSRFCSREEALAQYGLVQGMMMPVLQFPGSLLSSATMLLVPELARANATGRPRRIRLIAGRAFRMTSCFSFGAAAVVAATAPKLCELFYGDLQAANFIRIMAPLIPLLYLDSVVDGMLKGLNQQTYSLRYNLMDAVFRVSWSFFMIPILGLKGYLFLLFLSELFNAALSINRLLKVSDVEIHPGWILGPGFGAVLLFGLLTSLPV